MPPLALFLLALALRAWGVSWSLPYVGHVDEPKIVDSAVEIVKTGDFNPHLFIWPSLHIYLQAALYKINLLWGMLRGFYVGPESLPDSNHVFALAPGLYVWGRLLSATIGAAAVAVLFLLGRSMFNWRVGLGAALVLLAAPLHVEYSHYLVTDVAVGFFGLLTLAASWRLLNKPTLRNAALCGLLVGLTAATKYNGVYIALVPATALLLAPAASHPVRLRRLVGWGALMALVAALIFLITNPYVILDWTHWSRGFVFQIEAYLPAETLDQTLRSFAEHISRLWATDEWLIAPAALGLLLLTIDALRRQRWASQDTATNSELGTRNSELGTRLALLLPFPLVYTLLMSRFQLVYERNLLITFPFLCIFAGYLLDRIANWIALAFRNRPRNTQYAIRNTALIALAILLAAEPARQMINFDRYMAAPESRNLAAEWLMGELRQGKRAAVELHPLAFCAPAPHACPAPDVLAPNDSLTTNPPEWYAARGYDYVLLSGEDYLNVGDPAKDGPRDAAAWAAYKDLPGPEEGPRLFAGDAQGGKGPSVSVLRVGPGIDALPVMHQPGARFGDVAELWGYDLAPVAAVDQPFDPLSGEAAAEFTRGEALGINLYWRSLVEGAGVPGNWTVSVQLVAPEGATVAQVDVVPISHGRQRPVREWYQNEFVPGAYNLPLAPTLQPGTYTVRVVLYDAPTGPALRVTMPDGRTTDLLELGKIEVR